MEEGADHLGSSAQKTQGQADAVFQALQVGRALAGERVVFHPAPQPLVGVQFRGVGGQAIHAQPGAMFAQGRRVRKTYNGTTTAYFYSGSEIIAEKQGTTWTDYIFFGDQRIAKQTGTTASTATYLHTDHLGSTRLCTDSNGNSAGTCDYEPFGEVQPGTTCSVPTNYRFAGMEWDPEAGPNGLYHTWFRQHSSQLGRWSSPDPLGGHAEDPRSLNLYGYVRNDPINFVDALGLDGYLECIMLVGAAEPYCFFVANVWVRADGHGQGSTPPGRHTLFGRGGTGGSADGAAFELVVDGGILSSLSELPLDASLIIGPVAFTGAYLPKEGKVCVGAGPGIGISVIPAPIPVAPVSFSAGPLLHGNLAKQSSILSGGSWNFNVQATPGIGYQVVSSSAGTLGGPTAGPTAGVSATYTWSRCF